MYNKSGEQIYRPLSPFDAINQYFLFYAKHKQIFISKTGIEEKYIECDNKTAEQIAEEVT